MSQRFEEQEVRDILSQQHLHNTAQALQKPVSEVTADDLVEHWKRFHYVHPMFYDVKEVDSVWPAISDDNQLFV